MPTIEFSKLAIDNDIFSNLFTDFVEHFNRTAIYYSGNFRVQQDWIHTLEQVSKRIINRSELAVILSNQNRDFHCGIKTLANIDLLRSDNTFAVVTGQQVGLFTGPLYTLYKVLTTIKLADSLTKSYTEYNFVPIFWLEGEDHDFDEVRSVTLIDKNSELRTFSFSFDDNPVVRNYGAVGSLRFNERINSLFNQIEEVIVETEYTSKALSLFRIAYQPGMTFNKSFVYLINELLEDSGLIFIDPSESSIKQMLRPVFLKELNDTPKHCQLVIEQSDELERAYHSQVKPQPINLFMFTENGRNLIEPKGEEYSLKGILKKRFSKTELLQIIDQQPEKLSPNVVLRPICQDWLFPTVAYIAGPSEVAYNAQIKPLYDEYGIPTPILYPRASATLIEEKVEKICQRYNLIPEEFLKDNSLLKERVLQQITNINLNDHFLSAQENIKLAVDALWEQIVKIDPTLKSVCDKTYEKIIGNIELLKSKTNEAHKRANEVVIKQIDKASTHLYPMGSMQERRLNILHFLNKYGLEFLRWLSEELKVDLYKHQLIKM